MSIPINSSGGGATCSPGPAPAAPQGTTVTIPLTAPLPAPSSIWVSGPLYIGFDPNKTVESVPVKPEKKSYKDGCICTKCKELFPFSEPNQPDDTLICWACRHFY